MAQHRVPRLSESRERQRIRGRAAGDKKRRQFVLEDIREEPLGLGA